MNDKKLETLRANEGYDSVDAMLQEAVFDGTCPGICINPGCDYTTAIEPDQRAGHCETCGTKTVQSALYLAGVI
jgi:hypothetical protein